MDMSKTINNDLEMRRKAHEILDLCLQINGMQESKKSLTGDHPTVFFKYLGHVNGVDVCICNTGWEPGQSPDREWMVFLDDEKDVDELIDTLKREVQS